MMAVVTASAFTFGNIRVDSDSRQIWRDGHEVHLTAKAFDLLLLIAGRRPQAVSKADIRAKLWPDTFVSETNLPALVTEIRTALGDDARRPRFVRTVHRHGYAFCAEVERPSTSQVSDLVNARWWLVGATEQIPLFDGENVLGREGAGITIVRSATVSRRHARLLVADDQVHVEDLGSKNGTFVADEPVVGLHRLSGGQRLRLGSSLFTLQPARTGSTPTKSTDTPTPAR
jgi:DNA-binding winged helix-turn-helix (wHTH) protein